MRNIRRTLGALVATGIMAFGTLGLAPAPAKADGGTTAAIIGGIVGYGLYKAGQNDRDDDRWYDRRENYGRRDRYNRRDRNDRYDDYYYDNGYYGGGYGGGGYYGGYDDRDGRRGRNDNYGGRRRNW